MTIIDVIILLALCVFLGFGIYRGAFKELISLTAFCTAFVAAVNLHLPAARFLSMFFSHDVVCRYLGFLIIFGASYSTVLMTGMLIEIMFVKTGRRNEHRRAIGALLGMSRGLFIVTTVLIVFTGALPKSRAHLQRSWLFNFLRPVSVLISKAASDAVVETYFPLVLPEKNNPKAAGTGKVDSDEASQRD